MKTFTSKHYIIGIIIIVLLVGLCIFVDKGRCGDLTNAFPVMSEQYGPLTYVIAIEKECDGISVNPAAAQWMPRLVAKCKTNYYHLVGPTGKKPALMGITYTIPTEQVMHMTIRKYLMTITH